MTELKHEHSSRSENVAYPFIKGDLAGSFEQAHGRQAAAANAANLENHSGNDLAQVITEHRQQHLKETTDNYGVRGLMSDDPESQRHIGRITTGPLAARSGGLFSGSKDKKKSDHLLRQLMMDSIRAQIEALDARIAAIKERMEEIRESMDALDQVEALYRAGRLDPEKHAALFAKAGISYADIEKNGQSAIDNTRAGLQNEYETLRREHQQLARKREELANEYDRLKAQSDKVEENRLLLQTSVCESVQAIENTEEALLTLSDQMEAFGDIETLKDKEKYAALVEQKILLTEQHDRLTRHHQEVSAQMQEVAKEKEAAFDARVEHSSELETDDLYTKQTAIAQKLPEEHAEERQREAVNNRTVASEAAFEDAFLVTEKAVASAENKINAPDTPTENPLPPPGPSLS